MSLPYMEGRLRASVLRLVETFPLRLLSDDTLLAILDDVRAVVDDAEAPDEDARPALHAASTVRQLLEERGVPVPAWNPLGEPASFMVPQFVRYDREDWGEEDYERLELLSRAEMGGFPQQVGGGLLKVSN